MKLHLPHLLRRAVLRALFAVTSVATTLAGASYADMITPDGRTATSVVQDGSTYNVYTGTVRGNTGFNSFSTFDVYANTTANLHLADGTGKLINVVRDSASHIDGVLNSYKNGKIGGDVYFLNPNGIIVGKSGVINTGSISMSTPTAAFVEELIARDGSISPTATQAVMDGDMPINPEGTISVKGKVNAKHSAEMRSGTVEVKGGSINTGVKFNEMVNTGSRKVDTKGMNISGGKLSFGKKPSKKLAADKPRKTKKATNIAIFADDVFADGGELKADSVYIDPNELTLSNLQVSGDYTLEARVIVLSNVTNKEGEKLTSFTLNAANVQGNETFEGNVSITLANSNLVSDTVSLNASATGTGADATITITASDIKSASESGSIALYASSASGAAAVNVSTDTKLTAATITAEAAAQQGNAAVTSLGTIAGTSAVTLAATTGSTASNGDADNPVYTSSGSGNATLTVGGTVSSAGSLTLEAAALGTSGDAALNANGAISAIGTTTKKVGKLNLVRTEAETPLDTDSTAVIEAKNKAYLDRYATYLKTLESGTAATAELKLTATSVSGAAQVIQDAQSKLQASLSTTISAAAGTAADVELAGSVTGGNISATATGKTATLRVAQGAVLSSEAHAAFVETDGVTSVQQSNGAIGLTAKSSDEQDEKTPVPAKKDGVVLEVAGSVLARRSDSAAAGDISLSSAGKLSVTDTATLDASSAGGAGGSISFSAPEYALANPANYTVSGATLGSVHLENAAALELTGENISQVDSLGQSYVFAVTGLSGDAAKAWHGSYIYTRLSGNITLTDDVSVSMKALAIADNTHVYGNGHSLTLEQSFLDTVSIVNVSSFGNNVTIEGVKDFKVNFTKRSLVVSFADSYFGSPVSLTVGKDFHVTATGNVTFSLTGYGNTYIEFGSGLNINAGGAVTISATNQGGWGSNFFGYNTPTDLTKLPQKLDDDTATQIIGASGLIKFNSGRFIKQVINDLCGTDLDTGAKSSTPLQIGFMISKASVTFDDSSADKPTTVTGNTITISSSSTALVGGRQDSESESAIPALSITYLYNSSKVTVGNYVNMTATGSDKDDNSLTITSTTNSTNSPQHYYESTSDKTALGIDVNVSTVFNEVTIAANSTLTAKQNLTIKATDKLSAEAMLATSAGLEQIEGEENKGATAAYGFGLNAVVNNNKMTIDGELTSEEGDISCSTEDEISATLTMGSTLTYTIAAKEPEKKDDEKKDTGFWEKLWGHVKENLTADVFGLGKLDGNFKWKGSFEKDNITSLFKSGKDLYGNLWDQADELISVDYSVAVSITGVVVVNHNSLVFNGKAHAAEGSVTLSSEASIEENAGAESNIAGVPSDKAWTGSVSIPVLMSTCTTEVGANAVITAGKDISVSSSTELPMSFDVLGWNAWKDAFSKESKNGAADFLKALRGSFTYLRDYQDNGDFGLLDSLTSSHATSLVTNTGSDDADTATYGGDVVVDVRSCDTLTLIDDGAALTAGGKLSVSSESKGTHIAFAGKLPFFLTLGSRKYSSTMSADSGYGVSFDLDTELLNTVTYIGKAKLTAGSLEADSTTDIFTLVGSAGGTSGASADSMQGAVNIANTKHMTVTEVSNGASITLTGSGSSEVNADDKSALWNLSGEVMVSNGKAVGIGAAITVNNAYTAALMGNQAAIDSDWKDRWAVISNGHTMPYAGSGDISLTLGSGAFDVSASNGSKLINIGIAGSGTSDKNGKNATVAGAANVGIAYTAADTLARQDGVQSSKQTKASVSTTAEDKSLIVAIGGDVAASSGSDNTLVASGALAVNRSIQNTTATVANSSYDITGDFTVSGTNTSTITAVDLAVAVANSSFTGAAGSAWNSLEGTTGAYLTLGSVKAGDVTVSTSNDMTSFTLTLGTAVNFSTATGQQGVEKVGKKLEDGIDNNIQSSKSKNANIEDNLQGGSILKEKNDADSSGGLLELSNDEPMLLAAANDTKGFAIGASLARNAVDMKSEAMVTGCAITSAGALSVTAADTSVITAIGIGTAVSHSSGSAIGAGGVLSFAPVSSTTKAAIVQAEGVTTPLSIEAESLTLHATDKHRERVWSFGGGYGDSLGIGLVLSWGSFSGASTRVLMQNMNATLTDSADILASSDLDATFISVGASGSRNGAVSGMLNYLNFNNSVVTELTSSTLTVTSESGRIKALSEGKRHFIDGAGALAISVSADQALSGGVGAALSFVYVGGNGSDDKNLTQMLVSGSAFNNAGTTELLAQSSTTGTLAIANAAVGIGAGFAVAGSFSWVTDESKTQVTITGSTFNDAKNEKHKKASVKAEATSSSNLTVGGGTLGVQIGQGLGVGLAAAIVKDKATTTATMSNSRVNSANDFTLHASGKGYLDGLIIGAGASGTVALAGSGMSADIEHQVLAELTGSTLNLEGALTIKAENISKIGDGNTRFTLANGALGVAGGGLGVAVNLSDVKDNVIARAHNVSLTTGSTEVTATEDAKADTVTVNVAGGLYAGGNISVALPVLRGSALAEITSDTDKLADGSAIGITTTTGDLTVQAKNTQDMRSHVWTLAASVNPLAGAAVNICVNRMNMAGSAVAQIQGGMPLSVKGDMNVTADTTRTANYTTVAVSGSLGFSLGVDSNGLHVSSDTKWKDDSHKSTTKKDIATVDAELVKAAGIVTGSGVTLPDGSAMTVSASSTAMSDAETALETVVAPVTRASVDLGGMTATVGGAVTVNATDTITTTPTVVGVTGGLLGISFHYNSTDVATSVEALVNNSTINAEGNITIDAKQNNHDDYDAVGVAVGGITGQESFYFWDDKPNNKTAVTGAGTLKSAHGSVSIGASSDIKEDFTHVNVTVGGGTVVFTVPTFTQKDTTELTIGDNVTVSAADSITIGTTTTSKLDASLCDVVIAGVNIGLTDDSISYTGTQTLTLGNSVSLEGGSVAVQQNATRDFGVSLYHISVTGVDLGFPAINAKDTFTATMTIGNGGRFTAKSGDLTISSNVTTLADFYLYGITAIGAGAGSKSNNFEEKGKNTITIGTDAVLRAEKGAMKVAADSKHTGDLRTTNTLASVVSLADAAYTYDKASLTTDVSIGDRFDAKGKSLTLEAYNTTDYLGWGKKVSVSIFLNPFSKNAFDISGDSSASVTLAGGTIDTEEFITKARTDVDIKFSELLGGGSIVVDVNVGKLESVITQTATVTLGTGSNKLDILTDKTNITAHNKYRIGRRDASESMVYGGDFSVCSGNSKGTIDAKQTLNASVTLGSGSTIRRRADAVHYLERENFTSLISATNDAEDNVEIELFASGILNANCLITTKDQTTANATLTLNGSIDTWYDTDLTAYSHVSHIMNNSVTSVALIPTFNSWVTNTIDTIDTVTINGAVESVGDILIQAGSTKGAYTLTDGTKVTAGGNDTNSTNYFWGKSDAVIHNKRTETLTLNAAVRAGGNLDIHNDSSANTVLKAFRQTYGSSDYTRARLDTAAAVTSSFTLGGSAALHAGLGSAVQMTYTGSDGSTLRFITAQKIFDGSTQLADGTWQAPDSLINALTAICDTNGSKTLSIVALTLPGSAVRIVTKSNASALSGKVFSTEKHGLDITFGTDCTANGQLNGVTLRDHETGLLFNGSEVAGAVTTVAGPNLYRSEGLSARHLGSGKLYLSGAFSMPYNTLAAYSANDLVMTGTIGCGMLDITSDGNISINNPNADYNLWGATKLYSTLMSQLEENERRWLQNRITDTVKNSGDDEHKTNERYFTGDTYKSAVSEDAIVSAARQNQSDNSGVINSAGTVSITGKVVDLNGKIYSGYGATDYVIPSVLKLQKSDGSLITVEQAQALYKADPSTKLFKLDGIVGISLCYDAENNWITVASNGKKQSGITITGTIVNSDYTGQSGLYVASGYANLNVTNNSAYTLNIGSIDLSARMEGTVVLNNTQTGITTTYTSDASGNWTRTITNGSGSSDTPLGKVSETSYTGVSDYQLKLQQTVTIPIRENGRLTHGGSVNSGYKGKYVTEDGKIGSKRTMIDRMTLDTGRTSRSDLTYSYVDKTSTDSNTYVSEHTLSSKYISNLYDPGTFYRWKYELTYDDKATNSLYLNAAHAVTVHFVGSDASGSSFTATSGNINLSGTVTAATCTLTAANNITATADALLRATTATLTANSGSIGTAAQALNFSAASGSFTAGAYLYLEEQEDARQLKLKANKSLYLTSKGGVSDLTYTAGNEAVIRTEKDLAIKSANTCSAAYTTLSSASGSLTIDDGNFTPGILTAEAEKDISITTKQALTLDTVESRSGNVSITATGGITSNGSIDLSNASALTGTSSTSLLSAETSAKAQLSEDYYKKLQYYAELYYKKDADGKYLYRDANGNLKPDTADTDLAEIKKEFRSIYDSGKGDVLGEFIFSLSGSDTVGGEVFATQADALTYLAQHSELLETTFAEAFYKQVMAGVTADIRSISGDTGTIDYGIFNDTVYRMYWLTDSSGKYVNQDAAGNFISPDRTNGFGEIIGKVYNDATCAAITKQFKSQKPVNAGNLSKSTILATVAGNLSGYTAAAVALQQLKSGFSAVATGKTMNGQQTTIRATEGTVTLNTGDNADIGGDAFRFTISPTGKDDKGNFVYSDWANAFMTEMKDGRRAGTTLVSVNQETGERLYAMSYFEASLSTINELEYHLLQQAASADIAQISSALYRVATRNYIGVEAQNLNVKARSACVATTGDINLGSGVFDVRNLLLSTTGHVTGSALSTSVDNGTIQIYAGEGIGSAEAAFTVGGNATYSLASGGDISLKTSGKTLNVASVSGNNVSIDATGTSVKPTTTAQPNIIGRRINFTGDLNTGLGFRTFGLTAETGGLHWTSVAGGSPDVVFSALNTAYTFFFEHEGSDALSGTTSVTYSGNVDLSSVKTFSGQATFTHQDNTHKNDTLSFSDATFNGGLSFGGTGSYTVLNEGNLQVSGSSPIRTSGDAFILFDKMSLTSGDTIRIESTGDLQLGYGTRDDYSIVSGNLVVTSTGDAGISNVAVNGALTATAGGHLVLSEVGVEKTGTFTGYTLWANEMIADEAVILNGTWGVLATGVLTPRVVANSSESGVFLVVGTDDLSGHSKRAFVADAAATTEKGGMLVHDISTDNMLGSIKLRDLYGDLVLSGNFSAASLELYSAGSIIEQPGTKISVRFPFKNVRREHDSSVLEIAMNSMEQDMTESLLWDMKEGADSSDKCTDDAKKKRKEADDDDDTETEKPFYTDKNGKVISREEYIKLVAKK